MRHLPPVTLPLPDGMLPAVINLALVEALEDTLGSLYALAADLLAGQAQHRDMICLLGIVYHHAGCRMEESALGDYIMTLPAARMTTEILGAILTPLSRIDIAQQPAEDPFMGEPSPAKTGTAKAAAESNMTKISAQKKS